MSILELLGLGGIQWRGTSKTGCWQRVVFNGVRVDVGLLADYRRPAAIDFDELGPDFLLHCLVVKLNDKVLTDLGLGLCYVLGLFALTQLSLNILDNAVLLKQSVVCDGTGW